MHKFPENKEQRKLWVRFVRSHRSDFISTSSSVICSVHFEKSCFTTRYSVGNGIPNELKQRSRLIPGSIPNKDTILPEENPVTPHEKRKVS